MERFNPFSNSSLIDDNDPFTTSYNRSSPQHQPKPLTDASNSSSTSARASPANQARYTTNFPDPFKDEPDLSLDQEKENKACLQEADQQQQQHTPTTGRPGGNVTFAPTTSTNQQTSGARRAGAGRRQVSDAGGTSSFTSFLSRATSVTSSSMITDRVSGAVGSMKSAVDSISSQIQSVPANINERISSTASNLIGGSSEKDNQQQQQQQQSQSPIQQPPQSAASYLASKVSSATNQFTSSSSPSLPASTSAAIGGSAAGLFTTTTNSAITSNSVPISRNLPNQLFLQTQPVGNISRQRVILVLDNFANADWVQLFNQYYKLTTANSTSTSSSVGGLAQSALTSFFSSATAQLSGGSANNASNLTDGGDLIEQADFRDVSVLANQSSSTATVFITGASANIGTQASKSLSTSPGFRLASGGGKIIRPEYVVVRQRTKDNLQHMRGIVSALNYCLVPMFEPIEIWDIFQDRQKIFSKLLRVQKAIGKEHFPLVPQLYCQTYQDLLNYINSQKFIMLPCLACTGPLGKGKIRIENLQTLREFSSIMATNGLSCTIEQYLNVKSDLILQKLGTSLKLFRRTITNTANNNNNNSNNPTSLDYSTNSTATTPLDFDKQQQMQLQDQYSKQSASRQTSLGSSVLSSLIPSSSSLSQQQAIARRSSNSAGSLFEKMGEVSSRYKTWIDAIQREFDNKISAFCVKIAVTTDDREYIVGLSDCSMNFMGSHENQDEDRRSFVELIISNMNTVLPKNHISRQSSSTISTNDPTSSVKRTNSSGGGAPIASAPNNLTSLASPPLPANHKTNDYLSRQQQQHQAPTLTDKKKFISQTQINGGGGSYVTGDAPINNNRNYGQLSSRSQSVSMNQSEYLVDATLINKSSYFARRGSDRSDSLQMTTNESTLDLDSQGSQATLGGQHSTGLHHRQASLGQSFFDSTSTALSSFQKQSLSFFKRLDPNSSNTPPQSAKSDKGFARDPFRDDDSLSAGAEQASTLATNGGRSGYKSQSMDCSSLDRTPSGKQRKRDAPPKPPPPQSISYRQSSLASYSQQQRSSPLASASLGGSSNPMVHQATSSDWRQNSHATISDQMAREKNQNRGKVVRQNSALSAFEPFDAELATISRTDEQPVEGSSGVKNEPLNKTLELAKKATNFDSASITSGDSNSTAETTTAEDTMNNLKKTFASIFGDKCE